MNERLNINIPQDKRKKQGRPSRRAILKMGLSALAATTVVPVFPDNAKAAGPDVPTADDIGRIIRKTADEKQRTNAILGGNPEVEAKVLVEEIDGIFRRSSAKAINPDERLSYLTKVDQLHLDTKRIYRDFRFYLHEADIKSFDDMKSSSGGAGVNKIIEEKIQPIARELQRMRNELLSIRDDVNRKFPR